MSLVNISHPGRPGYDELVPSRYALPSPFAARSPRTCKRVFAATEHWHLHRSLRTGSPT
jgi:hypothetical protein